jgi:hypothetical protein
LQVGIPAKLLPKSMNKMSTNITNSKELKVTKFPQGKEYVPGIRIAGKWLKNCGFNYHDTVRITMSNGVIQLTKI